ncbi:MAG: DUF1761 domain-containing protein [Leptospira sp.]|nr:DUF1761 domain-containing protein [Leptospira sp.]
MEQIKINYLAIFASMVVSIIIGFLWYGPLFGKPWAKEMNMPADMKPTAKDTVKLMTLMIIGTFLTGWVLAHNSAVWYYLAQNTMPPEKITPLSMGLSAGIFTWLGFYLPQSFGTVLWDGKSWKLLGINTSCSLITLISTGLILSYWRP